MDEPGDRWTRWLAGTRTGDAAARLACALANDRSAAEACAGDALIDARLRILLASGEDGDAFTRAVAMRLRAERDGSRFVRTLRQRLPRRRPRPSTRPPTRGSVSATPSRLAWPVAVAVGVLALTLVWSPWQVPAAVGSIVAVRSGTQIIGRDGGRPARVGDRVREGDRVVAAAVPRKDVGDAAASLVLGGVRCEVAAGSELELLAHGVVRVHGGRVYAQVDHPPGPPRERWRVLAGDANLVITGTRFDLQVGERTIVRLEEGSITVANPHGIRHVSNLEECAVLPGHAPPLPRTITIDDLWRGRAKPPHPPIAAGLRLWLDARYGIERNGSSVARWRDPRDGRLSARQPVAGLRPQFIPDADAGRPALRFDGRATFLSLDGKDHFDALRQTTVVVRVRCPAEGKKFHVALGADSGSTKHAFEVGIRDGTFEIWGWTGTGPSPSHRVMTSLDDRSRWHHLTYRVGVTGSTFFVDGQIRESTILAGTRRQPYAFADAATAPTRYRIGGTVDATGQLLAGDIAEVMVFDRALDDAEIALLAHASQVR